MRAEESGRTAGRLVGRVGRRAADPAAAAAARPHPAPAGHHRRAGRPRRRPPVGQGRHRRSRFPAPGGARRAAHAARRHHRRHLHRADRTRWANGPTAPPSMLPSTTCVRARWSGATSMRCAWSPKRPPACPGTPGRPPRRAPRSRAPRSPTPIEALDAATRELLDKLLEGSPVGRTRDAMPGTPPDRPVQRLLAAGLLRQLDTDTVILPRLVGQVLRGDVPGPVSLTSPTPRCRPPAPADVDAVAAGAALDLLREVEIVLETLSATPVPELRSGGLGVREVKRLTKLTGIDERRLGLILEVSCCCRTDRAGHARTRSPRRSGIILGADRGRRPVHRISDRGEMAPDRVGVAGSAGPAQPHRQPRARRQTLCGAVGFAVLHGSTAGPSAAARDAERAARRARGSTRDSASRAWCGGGRAGRCGCSPNPIARPAHRSPRRRRGRAAAPSPPRSGECSPATADDAVIAAMAKVLPAPIDHFLLQADLTVIVPGPLERALAEQLAAVATVESAGAAMVYRITEASVRRALDTGKTAGELHALFDPPLQNPCAAVVDVPDRRCGAPPRTAAGRHGLVVRALRGRRAARAGGRRARRPSRWSCACSRRPSRCRRRRSATCSPRCEAPASPRPPRTRPGAIVDLRSRGARVPAPGRRRGYRHTPTPTDQTLGAIVAVLRKVASTPSSASRLDPAVAISELQHAAHRAGVGRDRLRRPGRGGDPAGGGTDQCPRRAADRLRPGLGAGEGVRDPPGHFGGVGGIRIMGGMTSPSRRAHDRRPPDRPVRQDPAARGRPRAGRRRPRGDRAVRRARARARAHPHLPDHPAGPVERPRRRPRRRAGGRCAGQLLALRGAAAAAGRHRRHHGPLRPPAAGEASRCTA